MTRTIVFAAAIGFALSASTTRAASTETEKCSIRFLNNNALAHAGFMLPGRPIVVVERIWNRMTYAEKKEFADLANCAIAGPGKVMPGLEFHSDMTNRVLGRRELDELVVTQP